ncbi:MAG: hypothetical protein AB7F86_02260 [Bdellovibrionales bacterium]
MKNFKKFFLLMTFLTGSFVWAEDDIVMATGEDLREFDKVLEKQPVPEGLSKPPPRQGDPRDRTMRQRFEGAQDRMVRDRPMMRPEDQQQHQRLQMDGPRNLAPMLGDIRRRQEAGQLPKQGPPPEGAIQQPPPPPP